MTAPTPAAPGSARAPMLTLDELRAEALAAGEPTRPYDRLADAQAAEGETALAEATAALTAALQMSANRWRR